jgi:hypothetical protein
VLSADRHLGADLIDRAARTADTSRSSPDTMSSQAASQICRRNFYLSLVVWKVRRIVKKNGHQADIEVLNRADPLMPGGARAVPFRALL